MASTPEELARREKQLEQELEKIADQAKALGLDMKEGDVKRLETAAGKLVNELKEESD
jgi:hypothetical protein